MRTRALESNRTRSISSLLLVRSRIWTAREGHATHMRLPSLLSPVDELFANLPTLLPIVEAQYKQRLHEDRRRIAGGGGSGQHRGDGRPVAAHVGILDGDIHRPSRRRSGGEASDDGQRA